MDHVQYQYMGCGHEGSGHSGKMCEVYMQFCRQEPFICMMIMCKLSHFLFDFVINPDLTGFFLHSEKVL